METRDYHQPVPSIDQATTGSLAATATLIQQNPNNLFPAEKRLLNDGLDEF